MPEEFPSVFYREFPSTFRWGVATASYQIEGATQEDGRGPSIWDTFSHTPGRVENGDTGDVACDHYHRFPADVELMARAGLQHYRLSLAWPRILPDGTGRIEPRGLAFYDRLVDTLLSHGIQPAVTLYHWDLPQALQDQGGWERRDIAERFRDYAAVAFQHLGDRVGTWITLNEPWVSSFLGYGLGVHAPGLKGDWQRMLAVSHHLLRAHGLAVDAFRAGGFPGRIGITLNLNTVYPASRSPGDTEAALLDDVLSNRWFLDPLFLGRYPSELERLFGPWPDGIIRTGDLEQIGQAIDFLGVNYYSSAVKAADPGQRPVPSRDVTPRDWVTDMGWPVLPKGLTDLLVRLTREYTDRPLMVTENGMAANDQVDAGRVHDTERIRYLRLHLGAMAEAIRQGANLHGYYLWSLMDNFEWALGYSKRFGIVYVDYSSQERLPKDSYHWYAQVLREFRDAHGLAAATPE
jgi:beta-glucosidase